MSRLRLALVPMLLSRSQWVLQAGYQRFMIPLGPVALASYLEKLNLPVEILVHDDIQKVLEFKPHVVGLSSVSENFGYAQNVAQLLKEKIQPFVIIGGPHFTTWPEFFPECFDLGVIGEGEIVLEKIIRTFLLNGIHKENLKNIPGVVLRIGDQKIQTERAPQITNLDLLPLPNRKRWVKNLGVPHIMTSRGCLYHCFFCAEPNIFKSFRTISAQRVADEVEDILENFPSTRHIRFYDDIFPAAIKRMREMAQTFEERGIPQKVSFSCFVHAKLVNEEIADLLKRMNFISVQFGAESGSQRLLQRLKPGNSIQMNQKALDILFQKGIHVGNSFVVGSPDETLDDMKKTFQFIKKNKQKLLDVEVNPAVALPGTDLWRYAMEKNLLPEPEKIDWTVFRDASHLCEFEPDRYIYLAEQIPLPKFLSMLRKMWDLVKEIQLIHGTQIFYRKYCYADFKPCEFQNPTAHQVPTARVSPPLTNSMEISF